jgi:hypothetical protein
MIHLEPDDPPLYVGDLPAYVELPRLDGIVNVFLGYRTFDHICKRRENEDAVHRELVLSRLCSVIAAPTHVGCLTGEWHKLDLWAWNPVDFSGVLVSLKCLSGETWVNTAFPLGQKTLQKHLQKHRLRPIEGA